MSAPGPESVTASKKYREKLIAVALITFSIGFIIGIGITFFTTENASNKPYYKAVLWDVYDYYVIGMRDMEAAADLIKANYYAQYLQDPYKRMWILDGPSPKFYAEDAMKQMDKALEILTKTNWPEEFRDEVSQLQTYITELRQLVLKMQEIANKGSYTSSDVDRAESILDSFHDYNDKIFDLIKGAP